MSTVPHILQTVMLRRITQVVHCTTRVVTSDIGGLVVWKAKYGHLMTGGCDVSCSKKLSTL